MSGIADGIAMINRAIATHIKPITPYRAIVTSVDGGMIGIRRVEAATADGRKVASCASIRLSVGDEVLVANLSGEPVVVDKIRRTVHATPTYTLAAAAGSAATALIVGDDRSGLLQITPGGTGITTGSLITITFGYAFATANLSMVLTPASSAARALATLPGTSTKTTSSILIATATALTSGSTYQWNYQLEEHPA